jgi:hypothetical protein
MYAFERFTFLGHGSETPSARCGSNETKKASSSVAGVSILIGADAFGIIASIHAIEAAIEKAGQAGRHWGQRGDRYRAVRLANLKKSIN